MCSNSSNFHEQSYVDNDRPTVSSSINVVHPFHPVLANNTSFISEPMSYCANRKCPNWKCLDDSAIIHGTCCGCPNIFGDDVPVLCSKDLKCPRLMKDLCTDFNYMILCCCSTNNNYYNIYSSS
ncbi:uncharacterized protein LOC114123124 isoform X2 [Aphis gossypii]|uniref:uncharacterized protein LOC114123124 isoform X2 n=1 Tax=Aphis gossypii TaxID=80765 RepID=UPI002159569F|nr:uncharacterized protein LOC114123124 isoform X2 [Aphis gossypii]